MASLIKSILGIAPTKEKNGQGFIPSKLGLKLGVDKVSGYQIHHFEKANNQKDKKLLVLCTEDRYFKMTNGVQFSTGNNVQETAVPLMHITNAGIDFDVVTPTGQPAILEDWSVPKEDTNVLNFMKEHQNKFNRPLSLKKIIKDGGLNDTSPFVAVFIPGGHGSMVGLPHNNDVGKLIKWVKNTDRYIIVVCHGPAALMAAKSDQGHPYQGYSMAIFPDEMDKQSPMIGYLPGHLPWYQCEELGKQGMSFVNKKITGLVHEDRKLLSGDSPKACNELGILAATRLSQ